MRVAQGLVAIALTLLTAFSDKVVQLINDLGWKLIPLALVCWAVAGLIVKGFVGGQDLLARLLARLPRNRFRELYEPITWILERLEEHPPLAEEFVAAISPHPDLPEEARLAFRKAINRAITRTMILASDLDELKVPRPYTSEVEIPGIWFGYLRKLAPLAKHGRLSEARRVLAKYLKKMMGE